MDFRCPVVAVAGRRGVCPDLGCGAVLETGEGAGACYGYLGRPGCGEVVGAFVDCDGRVRGGGSDGVREGVGAGDEDGRQEGRGGCQKVDCVHFILWTLSSSSSGGWLVSWDYSLWDCSLGIFWQNHGCRYIGMEYVQSNIIVFNSVVTIDNQSSSQRMPETDKKDEAE